MTAKERKSLKQAGADSAKESPRRGLEPIDTILSRWMKVNRLRGRFDRETLGRRWKEVVGSSIGCQTRVIDLTSGVLTVEVNSAALLQEISTYYRGEILESLLQLGEFQGIREVRFRPGTFG